MASTSAASRPMTSVARSLLMSTTTERLPRFAAMWTAAMPAAGAGPWERAGSRPRRSSTLVTSAPWSARIAPARATSRPRPTSRTCRPAKGPSSRIMATASWASAAATLDSGGPGAAQKLLLSSLCRDSRRRTARSCLLPPTPVFSMAAAALSTAPEAMSSATFCSVYPASARSLAECSPGSGAGLRDGPEGCVSPNSAGKRTCRKVPKRACRMLRKSTALADCTSPVTSSRLLDSA
mmetsp:Transcript_19338/g.53143  ORF Transcript_19338/g.53143 Transcript_19338/m.53143 type:complete len:237 (-) Transcript_19338:542-1252(-)